MDELPITDNHHSTTRTIRYSEGLTPNQIAARNIRRMRENRGWSQPQLAERLRQRGSPGWTVAMISDLENARFGADERGPDQNRQRKHRERQITANDLAAFARVLNTSVVVLLLPEVRQRVRLGNTSTSRRHYAQTAFHMPLPAEMPLGEIEERSRRQFRAVVETDTIEDTKTSFNRLRANLHRMGGQDLVLEFDELVMQIRDVAEAADQIREFYQKLSDPFRDSGEV